MFTACHPVLSTEASVALTLRLLGGLTTKEIARAFLVPESTVAQRIVRAKRTLATARVPFELPTGDDRAARLSSVLEAARRRARSSSARHRSPETDASARCSSSARPRARGSAPPPTR
jgi:predicted RNA polymerase sigma factor